MKWKDTGETMDNEESSNEEYFDEEQFSPWADQKDVGKRGGLNKIKVLFVLLVAAIVALVVAVVMLVAGAKDGAVSSDQLELLEERLTKLEERLDKFKGIDETVTTIWKQAKSYEDFKKRFNRTETSMSLRMDHLTISLEALQKQYNKTREAGQSSTAPAKKEVKAGKKKVAKPKYHVVQAGENLFRISKKYNLTVDQLRKMNKMKPDSPIKTGQKLVVGSSGK